MANPFMDVSLLAEILFSDHLGWSVLVGLLVISLIWVATTLSRPDIYKTFQRMGKHPYSPIFSTKPIHEHVQDGFREITKITGQPFTVRWWAKDYLLLPPKYLADLKGADWRHLSFFQNISDALYLHVSVGDLYASDRMVQVVKRGISPKLPQLTSILDEEHKHAFKMELGDSQEWKTVTAAKVLGSIAHRTASRIMIGEEVCRNEQFVRSSIDFVESVFTNALVIVNLPLGALRNLLSWPLSIPHRRKLENCVKMILPIVKLRIEERHLSETRIVHMDGIEWTLAFTGSDPRDKDPHRITEELLHSLWAASSAPGGLITEMLYQVLMEPQYLRPLRDEILKATSLSEGWSEKTLSNLPLQDSFIREINRLYPTGSITCSRTVLDKPFEFSDGLTLPIGTRFGFPIKAIQTDNEIFPNALIFDGFRFANIKSELVGDKAGTDFSAGAMSTTNLAFGYGNHICPGRHFAIRMVKMIFSKLIVEYDVEWEGIVTQRPPALHIEGQFIPNQEQKIRVRRRTASSTA